MKSDIVNQVAAVVLWDVFLMGGITVFALFVGFFVVTSEDFRTDVPKRVKQWLGDLEWYEAFPVAALVALVCYLTGIAANSISDDWMDLPPQHHLFLKELWLPSKNYEWFRKDTDNGLKFEACNKYYNLGPYTCERAQRANLDYYFAKNTLWPKDEWQKYILYSQKLVSLSRVMSLSFFVILVLACARALASLAPVAYYALSILRANYHKRLRIGLAVGVIVIPIILLCVLMWMSSRPGDERFPSSVLPELIGCRGCQGWQTQVPFRK